MQFKLFTVSLLSALAIAAPSVEERTITGYAVRKFTRDCTNPHICTYKFTIDSGDEQQPCTVVDETPVTRKRTGPLATTHAWYSKPCQEVSSSKLLHTQTEANLSSVRTTDGSSLGAGTTPMISLS
jgi:hypothetical protein